MHPLEILEGFTVGAVAYAVTQKLVVDWLAKETEEHIVQPALEFVKSSEFWDSLDSKLSSLGGYVPSFKELADLAESTLADNEFSVFSDGYQEAVGFAIGSFKQHKFTEKYGQLKEKPNDVSITNFITLRD